MKTKNRRFTLASAIGLALGLCCALVLGAVFYGAMAYQLLDGPTQEAAQQQAADPSARLVIAGARLLGEQMQQREIGGEICTEIVRSYQTEEGLQVEAICAGPAAYIERLSQEAWTPQLITGFALGGMEAVYWVRGEEGLLCARQDDRIYMIRAAADEQTLYALGADALLQ